MIDTIIVCTHDALKMAETLVRLLEAEQHRVRLTFGRQALSVLEDVRDEKNAVVLIWSPNARSQTYMIEWARKIDPSRLIELATIPDPPKIQRKVAPVDFSNWRGERGGRAWDALNERLRVVTRVFEPARPAPARALAAMGMVTAVAMAGAVGARMHAPFSSAEADTTAAPEVMAALDPSTGIGGPTTTFEPLSAEDDILHFRSLPDVSLINTGSPTALTPVTTLEPQTLRQETLLERLNAFNPLRDFGNNNPSDGG
jgi:hypothetical protein